MCRVRPVCQCYCCVTASERRWNTGALRRHCCAIAVWGRWSSTTRGMGAAQDAYALKTAMRTSSLPMRSYGVAWGMRQRSMYWDFRWAAVSPRRESRRFSRRLQGCFFARPSIRFVRRLVLLELRDGWRDGCRMFGELRRRLARLRCRCACCTAPVIACFRYRCRERSWLHPADVLSLSLLRDWGTTSHS